MPFSGGRASLDAKLPVPAANQVEQAGRLGLDPKAHGVRLAFEESHRLGRPEGGINVRPERRAVGQPERLPTAMRVGAIRHAHGVSVTPLPVPARREARGVGLLEAGVGKQVGPDLNRLEQQGLELDGLGSG